VARFVAGQQGGDVDVDGQQVADGILIFGAAKAAERIGAAGIGCASASIGGAVNQITGGGDVRRQRCVKTCLLDSSTCSLLGTRAAENTSIQLTQFGVCRRPTVPL